MKRLGMTPREWAQEKRRFGFALRMTGWTVICVLIFLAVGSAATITVTHLTR